jgi:hypothetical protein
MTNREEAELSALRYIVGGQPIGGITSESFTTPELRLTFDYLEHATRHGREADPDGIREFAAIRGVNGIDHGAVLVSLLKNHDPDPARAEEAARSLTAGPAWAEGMVSASDLQGREFAPVRWAVESLLPEGTTLFAGAPKVGKSWLALAIAAQVADGGDVMDRFRCEQGDVLYLALEDSDRRLKRRMDTLYSKEAWPASLEFHTTWRPLGHGGEQDLAEWIEARSNPRLVVIDTLARIRGPKGTQDSYSEDYQAMNYLTAITKRYGVAVLLVHHTRKAEAEDPLQMVSGTMGLTGGVDGVMVLKRDRLAGGACSLFVTGRDIEDENDYAVAFEKGRWTYAGAAEDLRDSDERKRLKEALSLGGLSMIDLVRTFLDDRTVKAGTPEYDRAKKIVSRAYKAGVIWYHKETKHYTLPRREF